MELHRCRCGYTCRSVRYAFQEGVRQGSTAVRPKCLRVTLAPALHHPAKDTLRSSSDFSLFLASWVNCSLNTAECC